MQPHSRRGVQCTRHCATTLRSVVSFDWWNTRSLSCRARHRVLGHPQSPRWLHPLHGRRPVVHRGGAELLRRSWRHRRLLRQCGRPVQPAKPVSRLAWKPRNRETAKPGNRSIRRALGFQVSRLAVYTARTLLNAIVSEQESSLAPCGNGGGDGSGLGDTVGRKGG